MHRRTLLRGLAGVAGTSSVAGCLKAPNQPRTLNLTQVTVTNDSTTPALSLSITGLTDATDTHPAGITYQLTNNSDRQLSVMPANPTYLETTQGTAYLTAHQDPDEDSPITTTADHCWTHPGPQASMLSLTVATLPPGESYSSDLHLVSSSDTCLGAGTYSSTYTPRVTTEDGSEQEINWILTLTTDIP